MVRAGLPRPEQGEPFLPGPVFAAPYHLSGDPYAAPALLHPLRQPHLGALRGGGRRARGRRGDPVLVRHGGGRRTAPDEPEARLRPGDGRRLLPRRPRARGDASRAARGGGPARAARRARGGGARVRTCSGSSRRRIRSWRSTTWPRWRRLGVATVVDNTTAGALLQRPLDLGATYALTSATKQMSGHADLMLGYVTTRDAERAQALRDWRRTAGAIPGPVRGLARAPLAADARHPAGARLRQRARDRAAAGRPRRRGGRALPRPARRRRPRGRPAADERLRRWSSPSTSASAARAERFLEAAQLVTDATSFGSVHTVRRAPRPLGRRRRARGLHPPVGRAARTRPTCWRTWSRPSTRAPSRKRHGCWIGSEQMDDWVWWIIAAGVLAVGEIATMGFFLGPIAVAATLAAVVAVAGGGLAVQWIVFIAASLGSLLVLRPIARRHLQDAGRASAPARPHWSAPPRRSSSAWTPTAARSRSAERSGVRAPTTRTTRSSGGPAWRS